MQTIIAYVSFTWTATCVRVGHVTVMSCDRGEYCGRGESILTCNPLRLAQGKARHATVKFNQLLPLFSKYFKIWRWSETQQPPQSRSSRWVIWAQVKKHKKDHELRALVAYRQLINYQPVLAEEQFSTDMRKKSALKWQQYEYENKRAFTWNCDR